MNCEHCGNLMRPETVIKLRRTLLGVRRSHYQGAYCMDCNVSIVQGGPSTPATPRTASIRPVGSGGWYARAVPPDLGRDAQFARYA
jgi:hypothetical protein